MAGKSLTQIMFGFATVLALAACGAVNQTSTQESLSSKSVGSDDSAYGEVHQLSELIENPELVELYRCGNGKKIQICHVPEGNPGNRHTLCLPEPAVEAHLREHDASSAVGDEDHLGACKCDSEKAESQEAR